MTAPVQISNFLEEILAGTDIFLIRIDISKKNDISIYLDGDQGLPIGSISKINRSLYQKIEEAAIFPDGDFSLEVGSPGVDEPLVFERQYQKHIGRNLEIITEEKQITGKLLKLESSVIHLEEMVNKKKKETLLHEIPFEKIKKAIVQISF